MPEPIVGIEVEYPGMNSTDEKYVDRGRDTSSIQSDINRLPSDMRGRPTYDGTVGLEIVSDTMAPEDVQQWYSDVIDFVHNEYNVDYQPTGLMRGGSTAGTHVHISPLSDDQARMLYDISQEPWAKVMFCSSIAASDGTETWPVFRGGSYCRMNNFNGGRYSCVNHRGGDHYEWRLPEPMAPEHVGLMMEFIERFYYEPEDAIEFAQRLLNEADDRITAIRRAKTTGMDIDGVPVIERAAHEEDPENFFDTVAEDWSLPEIYRVDYQDETFYVFESELVGEFVANGVTFSDDSVLRAGELTEVTDENYREVRRVFENRRDGGDERRETEATHELKKIVKKDK